MADIFGFQIFVRLMIRKQNLKNSRKCQQQKECMFCRFNKNKISVIYISLHIVNQKFYKPLQRSSDSLHIKQILSRKGSHFNRLHFRQTQYIINQNEQLKNYNNFHMTVTSIKGLILDRVKWDNNQPMHFHGESYKMMMRHHLSNRRLTQGKTKLKKIEKVSGSGISTDQDQKSGKGKVNEKRQMEKIPFGPKESQNVSIRRLTRNLSSMVRKFDDNLDFHPSLIFQLMEFVPGHGLDITKLQMQQIFKRELQDNFSIIKQQKQQMKQASNVPYKRYEQNYGLMPKERILQSRNVNKVSQLMIQSKKKIGGNRSGHKLMKQNIPERVQTDYDCQAIKRNKKQSSNSKKSQEKFSKLTLGSMSKNKKDHPKIGSVSKSRVIKGT